MSMNRFHAVLGLAAALFVADTASAQGRFFGRRRIYSSPNTPAYYSPPVVMNSPKPLVTTSDVSGTATPVVTIGRPAPETTTQWIEIDGYISPVTSLRTDSGSTSAGAIESPHVAPDFAAGYAQRLRVVTADGEFHNKYYGADGRWIGSNAYGPPPMVQQMYADGAQERRRETWGPSNSAVRSTPRRTSNAQVSNYAWSLINRNNQNYIPSGGGGGSSGGSRRSSGGGGGSGGSYYYSE